MSKQLTAILIGLILLTFGGLVLVSNYIGERKPSADATAATPLLTMTPKMIGSTNKRESLAKDQVSADLADAISQLVKIVDLAKINDWPKARGLYENFVLKNKRLPLPELNEPHISPLWQDYFDLYQVQLERALQEKQAKPLVIAANQMRGILSESQARLSNSGVPMEVQRMDFLIDELILWKDLGDEKMVQARKIALIEAWSDVASLLRTKHDAESISLAVNSQISKLIATENLQGLTEILKTLAQQVEQLKIYFAPKASQ